MKNLLSVLMGYALVSAGLADEFGDPSNPFEIPFVTIGNPGNPDDVNNPSGPGDGGTPHGGVNYLYRISNYEISTYMIDVYNALALRHGGPLISRYAPSEPAQPATAVNWNEAARFVNWLNTSRGFPAAYKFRTGGGNDDISLWTAADGAAFDPNNRYRNPEALYFLPSEDEWYKAAYYDPALNGGAGGYWDYATGSNSQPIPTAGGSIPGTAVHMVPLPALPDQAGGLSPYGTMAQNGNVWEWIESDFLAPNDNPAERRVIRGGSWADGIYDYMDSSFRNLALPRNDDGRRGIRVGARVLPPVIISARAHPALIWPPNGKMVDVRLAADVEAGTGALRLEILEIRCDEAHRPSDFAILEDATVSLRATRRGNGSGRTYTVLVRVVDEAGLSSDVAGINVFVPHDLRRDSDE